MPFEFAFLDWLQQFHNPVLDALVFAFVKAWWKTR